MDGSSRDRAAARTLAARSEADQCTAGRADASTCAAPQPRVAQGCGCAEAAATFTGQDPRYRAALVAVVAINASMFLVETLAGRLAGSRALEADALDFLGDSLTYGLTLWAVGREPRTRALAALIKGASLSLMAMWVLGSTLWSLFVLGTPRAEVMGGVGLLALVANLVSVVLLMRWREGDANVRSVWLCSRNDAIGNLAVVGAGGMVALTGSPWPDLLVAFAMAALFLHGSMRIGLQARTELRDARRLALAARAGSG
ncbi:MAG: cation transporter [Geminicoccaceae bacterium]|nr:cation transporter [Geminicoccaceae bacterium]